MNEHNQFEGTANPRDRYLPLARWLLEILAIPPHPIKTEPTSIHDEGGRPGHDYHVHFYQQLPDFVMALLKNDTQAIIRYAPLLYHLIGCSACHTAYLEIYDAMRATLQPDELHMRVGVGHDTHSLATTPPRMVAELCQLLISQAAAVLRQARHDHTDNDAWARSLLQQSIRISSYIMQSAMRQRALQDLVEVATLFDGATAPAGQSPAAHTYSSLVGNGSGARHAKTMRGADTIQRPVGQPAIYLQSGSLSGMITQNEDTLELHLEHLHEQLRGHYLTISVPLGSLFEPVRWVGGDPHAIHSVAPVDEHGTLKTPLGETDLRLTNPEEHNLLETMFKKLDVRPTA